MFPCFFPELKEVIGGVDDHQEGAESRTVVEQVTGLYRLKICSVILY